MLRLLGIAISAFFSLMGFLAMNHPDADVLARVFGGVVFLFFGYLLSPWAWWKLSARKLARELQQQSEQAAADWAKALRAGQKMDRETWAVPGTPLDDDEDLLMWCPAKWLEEQTVGYEGAAASVRVQLVKGVSVGTAGGKGRAKKDWVLVSTGSLLMTTKRVAFVGNLKSWSVPRKKVIAITNPVQDAILVQVSGKSYLLQIQQTAVQVTQAALEAA